MTVLDIAFDSERWGKKCSLTLRQSFLYLF